MVGELPEKKSREKVHDATEMHDAARECFVCVRVRK
jgi:hypothetical protein